MLKWCGSKQEFCCSRLISLTLVITQTFLLLTSRSQNFLLIQQNTSTSTGCVCTTFGTHIQVPCGRIGRSLGDDNVFYKSLQLPIIHNTQPPPFHHDCCGSKTNFWPNPFFSLASLLYHENYSATIWHGENGKFFSYDCIFPIMCLY